MISQHHQNIFESKINKHGGHYVGTVHKICGTHCWLWTGAVKPNGYGTWSIWVNQSNKKYQQYHTHRLSYELYVGKIPAGLQIMHMCDNRACCNPDHLMTGTPKQNTADMYAKNRAARGETHGNSDLTDEQVREIKYYWLPNLKKFGKTQRDLANDFGISDKTISKIKTGARWKHI